MTDSEEVAQDFLDRLDLDADDFESKKTVQTALDKIFQDFNGIDATGKQVDAIFNAGDLTKVQFPNVGIRKIEFLRLGKPQVRYAIPFRQGLFSFSKALDLFQNLV